MTDSPTSSGSSDRAETLGALFPDGSRRPGTCAGSSTCIAGPDSQRAGKNSSATSRTDPTQVSNGCWTAGRGPDGSSGRVRIDLDRAGRRCGRLERP